METAFSLVSSMLLLISAMSFLMCTGVKSGLFHHTKINTKAAAPPPPCMPNFDHLFLTSKVSLSVPTKKKVNKAHNKAENMANCLCL